MSLCENTYVSMTKVPRIGVDWSPASADAVRAARAGARRRRRAVPARACASRSNRAKLLLFTPAILGSSKNASFDPATGRLGGTTATGSDADALRAFIRRFSDAAASLVGALAARPIAMP